MSSLHEKRSRKLAKCAAFIAAVILPSLWMQVENAARMTEAIYNVANEAEAALVEPKKDRHPRPNTSIQWWGQFISHINGSDPVQAILNRNAKRIPGYLPNGTHTLFGFVMRDLATRICSRAVTSSHIVVVSEDADEVARKIRANTTFSLAAEETLRGALDHKVGSCLLLHAGRQGHDITGLSSNDARALKSNNFFYGRNLPSWVLLYTVDSLNSDLIMAKSETLLKNSTVTYIVVSIGSDGNGKVFGEKAVELLQSLQYKPQLLSLSHASNVTHREHAKPIKNEVLFRPNQRLDKGFFRAIKKMKVPVRGYAFATQGFDLAIPTATEYITDVEPKSGSIVYRKQCPADVGKNLVRVNFAKQNSDGIVVRCVLEDRVIEEDDSRLVRVWRSGDTHDRGTSEAVCVTARCINGTQSSCATRVLRNPEDNSDKELESTSSLQSSPNLLLLMIDPISRSRFERSFPKTSSFLELSGFVSFNNYTAVGNNSGPNQAALYSGQPLQSRETIANRGRTHQWLWDILNESGYKTLKSEDGCIENSNMMQSIRPNTTHGHELNQLMCFDFDRPNCVGAASAASHQLNYSIAFIEEYEKASTPWAAFLHFIDSHEDTMVMETMLDDLLWNYLQSILLSKGGSTWDNTMIVLMSDHGLHYGSYLNSPKGLEERSQPMLHFHVPGHEAMQKRKHYVEANAARKIVTPFDVHDTILEVLLGEKRVDPSTKRYGSSLLSPLGKERTVCSTTPGIPESICHTLDSRMETEKKVMPGPPSILSYYADIPMQQKKHLSHCEQSDGSHLLNGATCQCATDRRGWYNCKERPWENSSGNASETFQLIQCGSERDYEIRVSPDPLVLNRKEVHDAKKMGANHIRPNILVIEIDSVSTEYADRHFPRTRELLQSMRVVEDKTGYRCSSGYPVCSASFPFTSVSGPNSIPNQIAAFSGCFVTTGPERCNGENDGSSVICQDPGHMANGLFLIKSSETKQIWCPNKASAPSPWLFDIARKAGYATLFAEEFCYDDSPWVTQGNYMDLQADVLPHTFFCRVAEGTALQQGKKIPKKNRFRLGDNNVLHSCLAGDRTFPRAQVALQHISSMWDAYHDTSKFAFFNAMAAHAYKEFDTMAAAAEAYDDYLHQFLTTMLNRNDAKNTIIVVRSDHGLQGGKKTVDYSTQVEALRPWTEVIVPKQLKNLSLNHLFRNQQQLTTGADLYRSLAETMSTGGDNTIMPKAPSWSINYLSDPIPPNRTCSDAMVQPDYCFFEGQRSSSSPNLGTCNLEEPDQALFCPGTFSKHRRRGTATQVGRSFLKSKIVSSVCPLESQNRSKSDQKVLAAWSEIDAVVDQHPSKKISGGIFLYPRQASILSAILQVLGEIIHGEEDRPINVCETGFGAGHSAALFLEASPYTKVHTFDKFDRPYQIPVYEHLEAKFPGRTTNYKGNSCKTVPKALSISESNLGDTTSVRCDFLHGSSLCPTDNLDLVAHSPEGILLSSTAMHSIEDNSVYFGPEGQWTALVKRDCIHNVACFKEDGAKVEGKFIFQEGQEGYIQHSFCLAITTGKCQTSGSSESNGDGQGGSPEYRSVNITRSLVDLGTLCPTAQVPTPFSTL